MANIDETTVKWQLLNAEIKWQILESLIARDAEFGKFLQIVFYERYFFMTRPFFNLLRALKQMNKLAEALDKLT